MAVQVKVRSTSIMTCACPRVGRLELKAQAGAARGWALILWDGIPLLNVRKGIEFQEARYGKDKRVHNPCFAKGKFIGLRCTICGTLKRD